MLKGIVAVVDFFCYYYLVLSVFSMLFWGTKMRATQLPMEVSLRTWQTVEQISGTDSFIFHNQETRLTSNFWKKLFSDLHRVRKKVIDLTYSSWLRMRVVFLLKLIPSFFSNIGKHSCLWPQDWQAQLRFSFSS